MPEMELLEPTGNEKIDRVLKGLIELTEMAFPERVRGYYLGGSHHEGTGIDLGPGLNSSDLDVFIEALKAFENSEDKELHEAVSKALAVQQA